MFKPVMTFRQTTLVLATLAVPFAGDAKAQIRVGGFPTPEESFQRMDRNGNGQIDRDEIESLPSFIRDMYTRQGIDGSRPISRNDFIDVANKIRDDFRARMERGDFGRGPGGPSSGFGGPPPGGFGGPGGGPPSSFGSRPEAPRPEEASERDERRDDRRRDGRDERREDESRDRDRKSSGSASRPKKTERVKVRVTKELPSEYRDRDKNNDGQVALYEWDRKAFAQFQQLDLDRDGFLTPAELLGAASKKESDKPKSTDAKRSGIVASTYKLPVRIEFADAHDDSSSVAKSTPSENKGSSPAPVASSEKTPGKSDAPADTAFRSLDTNNDGQLDADEWERARSARKKFEKAGVALTLPIKQSQFVELYSKAGGS